MLDRDLAELYEVETKALKQAVKRNIDIFPTHFMFELNQGEFDNLRSQTVTSSWGGQRYLPYVFTDTGLRLEIDEIKNKLQNYDKNIELVFQYLDELLEKKENPEPRPEVGDKRPNK